MKPKTFTFFLRAIWHSPLSIGVVVVGGLAAGVIATVKSLFEAAIIQAFANAIHTPDDIDVLGLPLTHPSVTDGGRVTAVTGDLLGIVSLGTAIAIYVVIALVSVGITIVTATGRAQVTRTLYTELYAKGLAATFHTEQDPATAPNEPGGLAGSVQQGARSVAGGYAYFVEAGQYLFAVATILFSLLAVSPWVSLGCLAVAGLCAGVSWRRGSRLSDRRKEYDESRRTLMALTDDIISNRDVLLAQEQKGSSVERLTGNADQLAEIDKALTWREGAYSGSVAFIYDVGRIGMLGLVFFLALHGTPVERVGDAYFYLAIFTRLMSPIQGLLRGYDDYRRSLSTSETLMGLLNQEPPARRGRLTSDPADMPAQPAARLTNVGYVTAGQVRLIDSCTFTVPAGGVTLLLGESGAGKTTIARLLLGLSSASSGEVEVLGRNVQDWDHEEMLRRMSYLSQTGHVIAGSIRANLFVDHTPEPPPTPAELGLALYQAGLAADATDGESLLGQSASALSEGQKQRLALARILVDRSPVVVLDEPLAGVDAFTFQRVYGPLHDWMASPDRTVVLISHRLEFASTATHVVVIDRGGFVLEEGAPADLSPNGRFRRLLELERTDLDLK